MSYVSTFVSRGAALAAALALAAAAHASPTLLGGVEDSPGSTGYEKNGDYNDMMFKLTGNISIVAPGGVFNNLTPLLLNEQGTIFWNQPSLDGAQRHAGYCFQGAGGCTVLGAPFTNFQYLAAASGAQLFNIMFQAEGPVSVTLLGEIAGLKNFNTLGWYNPAQPGSLFQLFSGPAGVGATATFNPQGTFALYSTNSLGQFYSSIAAHNVNESVNQQHFAFFFQPGEPAPVPEPATFLLSGLGLIALGLRFRRR